MITIREITAPTDAPIVGLMALLGDAVDRGASVGFLAPLATAVSARYWDQVLAGLGRGLHLWIAESDERVVGSVQLAPCLKPNGLHRAELQKLLVLSEFRGRRIATCLMATVDAFAASAGLRLLVLDTEVGSPAEAIYRRLGWQKVGEVPEYAARPDGRLNGTAYYFKFTAARVEP